MALKDAASEGLFSRAGVQWVDSRCALSTYEVDSILRDPNLWMDWEKAEVPTADMEIIQHLCSAICERSALLAALNISAALLKSSQRRSSLYPVCVNIDGSVYYKIKGFSRMVGGYLERILGPRNVSYELIRVDDSPLIGAAVAGLMD